MAQNKIKDNRAWMGVLPVLLIVAFSGVIPLMTVVNYSVQDILDFNTRFFIGLEWYRETLADPRFIDAFLRQIGFSGAVLFVEIPLGIIIARGMPTDGLRASLLLVLLATPLLIPWNVVGTIWQIYARPDIGLLGVALNELGIAFNYTSEPLHAWITLLAMDIWHWTSLVALFGFCGPHVSACGLCYQAAELDGASKWQVFRYVELPRLKGVLVIAVLLRLMDSFMIYTEPFVLTGGGPGNTTTFLSQYLATMAVGNSIWARSRVFGDLLSVYSALQLAVLYQRDARRGGFVNRGSRFSQWILLGYCIYLILPLYWLLTMALRSNADIAGTFELLPSSPTLANFAEILTNPVWYEGFANSLSYVVLNTLISVSVALPAAYVFSRYRFLGDRQLFFLASDQPDGTASGVFAAVFSAVFFHWFVRYPLAWPCTLLVHGALSVWILKALCPACQRKLTTWHELMGIAFGSLLPVVSYRSIVAPSA